MDLDRLGISASLLCILHCLFTPILVLISPLFGTVLSHSYFHILIAVIVFPLAIVALWRGYKIHHTKRTLYLGGMGLVFVLAALISGELAEEIHRPAEITLMVIAGILLSLAHYLNLKSCRAHRHT